MNLEIKSEFLYSVPANQVPLDGWASLPAPIVQRAIHRSICAVSKDETRPNVNALLIEAAGRTLTVAGTDGHRLHLVRETVDCSPFRLMLPRPAAVVLDAHLGECGQIDLHQDGYLRCDGRAFRFNVPSATFLRYVMPTRSVTEVIVPRAPLRRALLAMARVHPEGTCSYVRAKVSGEALSLSLAFNRVLNPDFARIEVSSEIPVIRSSSAHDFAFTARYLVATLRCLGGSEVRLSRDSDPWSGIAVTTPESDFSTTWFVGIVMPVRL